MGSIKCIQFRWETLASTWIEYVEHIRLSDYILNHEAFWLNPIVQRCKQLNVNITIIIINNNIIIIINNIIKQDGVYFFTGDIFTLIFIAYSRNCFIACSHNCDKTLLIYVMNSIESYKTSIALYGLKIEALVLGIMG